MTQFSEEFTYGKLIRFTLPTIAMMIFTSIYSVVDGFFVSNFVGKTAFTAVNFIYPVIQILGSVGFMIGTGGSAIIGKTMGMRNTKEANEQFSFFIYVSVVFGIVLGVVGYVFIPNIALLLGASDQLLTDSIIYARTVLIALPAFLLQFEFQSFIITSGKPHLGLAVTVLSGVSNMVLDLLFVAVFKWGLVGAAAATAISQFLGGITPLIYFARDNSSALKLGKTHWNGRWLLKAGTNGSSELLSNVSASFVSILYNTQLLKLAGQDGVAAYGVLMYVSFIFAAVFIGYSIGTAPIISYKYGADDHEGMRGIRKKSYRLILIFSLIMFASARLLARPLSQIFIGYDADLLALTLRGFSIFSFAFLFSGIAIFTSSFFTALNNGLVSAVISFLRTLVFPFIFVLALPVLFGIDGIWYSLVAAEVFAVAVSVFMLVKCRSQYSY